MGIERASCGTLAEALGHPGPHLLQHFLTRSVCDRDAVRDHLARWTAGRLASDCAVLVVDETRDEKPSADAVGAARQYSGALGGIGLCQVAVHLTYASRLGHALLDRALYLTKDWAADDERRELTGVPDEPAFATKPRLAAVILQRARKAGLPARWVAADEVYRRARTAAWPPGSWSRTSLTVMPFSVAMSPGTAGKRPPAPWADPP